MPVPNDSRKSRPLSDFSEEDKSDSDLEVIFGEESKDTAKVFEVAITLTDEVKADKKDTAKQVVARKLGIDDISAYQNISVDVMRRETEIGEHTEVRNS
ncbi:hypothetical protein [Candidatus Nanohalococcus occultus]|uniref:hypothetical protein n=1 Tax=Candidatus Nanohalococcus occultus TaxID=2978047 RepID=UPI0039E0DE23